MSVSANTIPSSGVRNRISRCLRLPARFPSTCRWATAAKRGESVCRSAPPRLPPVPPLRATLRCPKLGAPPGLARQIRRRLLASGAGAGHELPSAVTAGKPKERAGVVRGSRVGGAQGQPHPARIRCLDAAGVALAPAAPALGRALARGRAPVDGALRSRGGAMALLPGHHARVRVWWRRGLLMAPMRLTRCYGRCRRSTALQQTPHHLLRPRCLGRRMALRRRRRRDPRTPMRSARWPWRPCWPETWRAMRP
mmetsp:Transcript_35295/g.76926  ORF Transcript_35295/g.76926 Transcript_35295/m.76926 type:complete len:253 (-) Transcript_35295:134-892(-)